MKVLHSPSRVMTQMQLASLTADTMKVLHSPSRVMTQLQLAGLKQTP